MMPAVARTVLPGRPRRSTTWPTLSSAPLSDGAELKVGQVVLRLGRPGKTVRATAGIISALGREPWRAPGGTSVERYLESDADHVPGFSGGPLVGADGKVLGINTTALT